MACAQKLLAIMIVITVGAEGFHGARAATSTNIFEHFFMPCNVPSPSHSPFTVILSSTWLGRFCYVRVKKLRLRKVKNLTEETNMLRRSGYWLSWLGSDQKGAQGRQRDAGNGSYMVPGCMRVSTF